MKRQLTMVYLAAASAASVPGLALSQAIPDAGAIMRETEQLRRPDVPALSPVLCRKHCEARPRRALLCGQAVQSHWRKPGSRGGRASGA
ncbi:MAG: hypothetical protein LRY49_10540 [Burkholderiaceae bacterium]|nr:hypothetical protein [Burkholderiaceae bacterium]